jgi:aldose 1-epimerase
MEVIPTPFGSVNGQAVTAFTLSNSKGMRVRILDYGGIVSSMLTPDRAGRLGEVTLGYDHLEPYLPHDGFPYFGAIIGRYANRIAHATFTLDGHTYYLNANLGAHTLHGGLVGFDKKIWAAEIIRDMVHPTLELRLKSPDGEEGYPGDLDIKVRYQLTDNNALVIDYEATTTKSCPVNLTNHAYFNLSGGLQRDVLQHRVMLHASHYTEVDDACIPSGRLLSVKDTELDFRQPKALKDAPILMSDTGFDHNFVIDHPSAGGSYKGKIWEPESGRWMEFFTTEPGVQLYTSGFLDGSLRGHGGQVYGRFAGLCLEAQRFPDSPNRPEFPNSILHPGETYRQTTIYQFGAE